MRISTGDLKGRALNFRFREKPRPTTGLVKKALFSLLASEIQGTVFFDMFAGSGAVGVEAVSQGAAEVWFAERDVELARSLKENLLHLKVAGGVMHDDARKACITLRRLKKVFNVVYIDPPYHDKMAAPALEALSKNHLLAPSAVVVYERSKKEPGLPAEILKSSSLEQFDTRTYGICSLDFFRRIS